jgi:hypothetical protein
VASGDCGLRRARGGFAARSAAGSQVLFGTDGFFF